MKPRHLLAITPLAALWVRQLRFEKRLAARQRALEADTRYFARAVNEAIEFGAKGWNRWGDELQREIRRVLAQTPGGARR